METFSTLDQIEREGEIIEEDKTVLRKLQNVLSR